MVTLYFNNRTFLNVDVKLKEISELLYRKRGCKFIFLKSMSGDVLINPSDISYILELPKPKEKGVIIDEL